MAEELKNATSEDSFFRRDFEIDVSNKESCRTFIIEPETPIPAETTFIRETNEFSAQCDEVTEQLHHLQNEKEVLRRNIKGLGSVSKLIGMHSLCMVHSIVCVLQGFKLCKVIETVGTV